MQHTAKESQAFFKDSVLVAIDQNLEDTEAFFDSVIKATPSEHIAEVLACFKSSDDLDYAHEELLARADFDIVEFIDQTIVQLSEEQ